MFSFVLLGTIRSNIDPSGKYSDAVIWSAIEKVYLKKLFPSLEAIISENGSNFSSGQKQLVCLARSLVSENKIIVLDEATASMDPETCKLLQQTIRKNFSDCTVITIAHRLSTICDSDKVRHKKKWNYHLELSELMKNLLVRKILCFFRKFNVPVRLELQ